MKKELTERNKERMDESKNDSLKKITKVKLEAKPPQKESWIYNNDDPKYCYCGKPSYGEMVACESIYCEREWFHLDCIEEKNLPEKWFCNECKKLKEKTRNPIQKSFF